MNGGTPASSTPPLLELAGIEVVRAGRRVLSVAALALETAQVVLVSGANGAGKTTLLKLLAGLLVADCGSFRGLGQPLAPAAAARFCRGRHVYLHQIPYMFDASVAANVAYGLAARGRAARERRVEVQAALAWAGLEGLADRPARSLSVGEQQRVALTRARVLAPPLLLLDEVTANLDAEQRRRVHALLGDLRAAGTAVLVASHDPVPLYSLCDREFVVAGGRVTPRAVSDTVVPLRR